MYKYDLAITSTPGLQTLQIEAVKQKIAEIAEILKPDLKDAMKIQMTPWKETHKVGIEELYTRLRIEKHTIKLQKTEKEELSEYKELFKDLGKNKRILIKGNPGIGKTTFSRKIVYDWANNDIEDTELKSIVLMFLVTLKYIKPAQTIEDMIKQQHKCLVSNKEISRALLKDILEKFGQDCLIILEGYDEIPKYINENLEMIVTNKAYRNCHFLITSRPNEVESLEDCMASIASIEGFSKENTRKYIEKVINDETKWEAAFKYTENSAIEEMWRYPILVLFLCLLVNWDAVDLDKEKLMVGEFYTRLLNCIFRRFIAEKIEKEKQEEEEAKREETLLKIGKVALGGILSNKVTYRKREILEHVGLNAFQYGILIGTDEWEGRRDMPEDADIFVYFVHKSIQEYLAAKYLIHQMSQEQSIESLIGWKRTDYKFLKNNLMFFTFCGYFTNESKIHDTSSPGNSDPESSDTEKSDLSDSDSGDDSRSYSRVRRHYAMREQPDSDSDGDSRLRRYNPRLIRLDSGSDDEPNEDNLPSVTPHDSSEGMMSVRAQLVDFIAKCLDVRELKLEGVAIYEESSWLFLEALPKCSQIRNLVLKDMKLKVSVSFLLRGIFKSLRHLSIENCEIVQTGQIVNEDKTFSKLKTMAFSGEQDSIHELLNPVYKHLKNIGSERIQNV